MGRTSAVLVALLLLCLAPAHMSLAQSRTADLNSVLAAYKRAQGTWTTGRPETSLTHWTIAYGDLQGTETDIVDGTNSRTDSTLGDSSESYGTFDGRDWDMNSNGEVFTESGVHTRLAVDDRALHAAMGAVHGEQYVRLTGRVSKPFDAYVVEVDPPKGVFEQLYIDATTWLLDERFIRYPGHTTTYTYDDYRTTLGLTFPWHIHASIDDGRQEQDMRLQDVQLGSPVDPSTIAIPQSKSIVGFSTPRTTIPATIVDDRVIVPVQMDGHTVNLQLDSGASGIVIDRGIIEALHYAERGHFNEVTAGAYVESDAVVPLMSIGTLSMHGVHVESLPFASYAGDKPVAGLLGFDFIDSVVLHIDYADGTVEAIDPQTFVPPPNAVPIPISLDDQEPSIVARIGPAEHVRLIVDTGADRSLLFSGFSSNHPGALVDQGLGTEMEAAWPFLGDISGVGGEVSYRPVDLGPVTVASWTFPRWLFFLTQDPSKLEIEDYDGLLGQDFLRYYDLYLDYPHGRILLVPNARYNDRFGM